MIDMRLGERHQWAVNQVSKVGNAALRTMGELALEKTVKAIKSQATEVTAVKADPAWSDTGRTQEISKVQQKYAADIKSGTGFLKAMDDRIGEIESEMTLPEPENEVLQYLKLSEVRQTLAQKTPQEVAVLYERDTNKGEYSLTVQAIEGAPIPYGFVNDRTRATTHRARLLKAFPEKLKEVKQLQDAASAVRRLGEVV